MADAAGRGLRRAHGRGDAVSGRDRILQGGARTRHGVVHRQPQDQALGLRSAARSTCGRRRWAGSKRKAFSTRPASGLRASGCSSRTPAPTRSRASRRSDARSSSTTSKRCSSTRRSPTGSTASCSAHTARALPNDRITRCASWDEIGGRVLGAQPAATGDLSGHCRAARWRADPARSRRRAPAATTGCSGSRPSTAGPFALKTYVRQASDPRDRLGTEFMALEFLHRHGITCVPRPIAADAAAGCALHEWIEGEPPAAGRDTLAAALALLGALDQRPRRPRCGAPAARLRSLPERRRAGRPDRAARGGADRGGRRPPRARGVPAPLPARPR